MRFSIISCSFVFLLLSCAIPTTKGLPEYNSAIKQFHNSYFSNVDTDYVYKAKINAFGNSFGGILIIKKIKDNNHRIVFTTNFGNTIFDFELLNNEFKTHYIMEEIDRNIIINTLKRDFETLTQENNKVYKAFKGLDSNIYQSKLNKRYNYYVVTSQLQELIKIVHTTSSKEKTTIKFNNILNTIAESINIHHKNSSIIIDLVYLNNN